MIRHRMSWLTLGLFLLIMLPMPLKQTDSSFAVNAQGNRQRNVNMRFEFAGGSGGSPANGSIVTVRAGGRTFQRRTNSNGNVQFRGVPCGGTLSVSFFDQEGTDEAVSRTLPFPCGNNALTVDGFFVCSGKLNLFDQPNLSVALSGINTRPIQFQPGRNAEVITDSIVNDGIRNFLLDARRGQELRIHLTSRDNVKFDVYLQRDPQVPMLNEAASTASCGSGQANLTAFTGRLPESGTYVVSVYATNATGNGSFSLDVIIR
jgi:hypothetical protein